MIRFFADGGFNNNIIRGLRRQLALIDIVRVQDVGLRAADDDAVIAWASKDRRVVLTHDARALVPRSYDVEHSGIIVVPQILWKLRTVIRDIALIAECMREEELAGRVLKVPL